MKPWVFPTHVGVFPARMHARTRRARLPHARGGVSDALRLSGAGEGVFPTHVGVFPPRFFLGAPCPGLPHARGGVSSTFPSSRFPRSSSPRTWGCFSLQKAERERGWVFPTHVGVFLSSIVLFLLNLRLPHARGGVSRVREIRIPSASSSPRTWGCFSLALSFFCSIYVFPTHVGVFLDTMTKTKPCLSLPHARGGVSSRLCLLIFNLWSSPRTWGCFHEKVKHF